MTAETLTALEVALPPASNRFGGVLHSAFGIYKVEANVEDGDIFEMLELPAKCLVVGGQFWTEDLDTGTETLDMDVGWASNGGGSETIELSSGREFTNAGGTADPDGFVNAGVLTGDAVTSEPEVTGGNYRQFHTFVAGPKYFSRKTKVQVEANAAAATFAAGNIWVRVDYLVI